MAESESKHVKREKMNLSLPYELIIEILSRLTVCNLWPLRYVCKTWFRLLTTDPDFAKYHFNRSIQLNTNPSIIARTSSNKCTSFHLALDYTACNKSIKLKPPFNHSQCHGICNGLLCLSNYHNDEIYIWNPITNDHITIPNTDTPCTYPKFRTKFAFGFYSNEYKVVTVFGNALSVYTLGVDSSWRTVVEDTGYDLWFMRTPSPVVNGGLHWLASRTWSSSFCTIMAFDLKYELLREVPPPNDVGLIDRSPFKMLSELGGQLSMFYGREGEDHVQVWVMEDYGVANSWIRKFKIRQPGVYNFSAYMEPLGVVASNGDIILMENKAELILYHPETDSNSSLTGFGFKIFRPQMFIGSIISPRVISGARNMKTEDTKKIMVKDNGAPKSEKGHPVKKW